MPGVTIYGYMCTPILEYFGSKWFESGSAKLRILKPFFEGEWVEVTSTPDGDSLHVEALGPRSIIDASMSPLLPIPASIPHWKETNKVPASEQTLAEGTNMGSYPAIDLYTSEALLEAANKAFMSNFVLQPWIHTGSIVQHFNRAPEASVRGTIVKEYERKGHRLVDIDYCFVAPNATITARVLHTAIWKLRSNQPA